MVTGITVGVIKESLFGTGNGYGPIPFLELRLIAKGSQAGVPNTDLFTLEIGDFVEGMKDANTKWKSAMYNGGDPNDRNSYTPIVEIQLDDDSGYIPPAVAITTPDYSSIDHSPLDYSTI